MKNLEIKVEHVTRLEGHGNIFVSVRDGRVEQARLDIVESPRFFEVMLQGRVYTDASWITSRICGICAVSHSAASLRATEDAFGITPSRQTVLLRKLLFNAEVMQSHILHAFFLALPDFLGVGSVVPLAATHGDIVKTALGLKKLANDLCAAIGGRHVHPVSMVVNGFTKLPEEARMRELMAELKAARSGMDTAIGVFAGIRFPEFNRETEYLSLKGDGGYPFYEGDICSSGGYVVKCRDYKEAIKETVLPTSTAKHVKAARGPFMVGALARFNNNHGRLHPAARAAAARLGLSAPCHNPFMITAAQAVETVHCLEDSITLIDELLTGGMKPEDNIVRPRQGRGVGVVEAPRGTLYHDYTYDENGRITGANCIIPTGQNLANIEQDIRAILPGLLDGPEHEAVRTLKMLVRAYDPCISCSVHRLEITIRRA